MRLLAPQEAATLRPWLLPDRPGPLIGLHMLNTGHGSCHVDRWPDPRAAVLETARNYVLVGSPDALMPADLHSLAPGFIDAPEAWLALLRTAFPELQSWERVIFSLPRAPQLRLADDTRARRLVPDDAPDLAALPHDLSWISNTWGGPAGLAASGMAWGAFVDGRLASVACSFFVGDQYEEIGIVTDPAFRGQGLGVACAARLCDDIQDRGRTPSWTTSTDNLASIRVAEKLGFVFERNDWLYLAGIPIPPSARLSDTH